MVEELIGNSLSSQQPEEEVLRAEPPDEIEPRTSNVQPSHDEEKIQTEVTADEVRSKRNVERTLRRRIESLQHKLRLRTRQLRNAVNRNCKQETRYDEICERVNASMKNSEFTCKEAEIRCSLLENELKIVKEERALLEVRYREEETEKFQIIKSLQLLRSQQHIQTFEQKQQGKRGRPMKKKTMNRRTAVQIYRTRTRLTETDVMAIKLFHRSGVYRHADLCYMFALPRSTCTYVLKSSKAGERGRKRKKEEERGRKRKKEEEIVSLPKKNGRKSRLLSINVKRERGNRRHIF